MNYWVESYVASSSAVVWVKVPSVPSGNSTIYMYYGNPGATSASNPANTFVRVISNLRGSWNFDENSGSVAYDKSGYNNNANLLSGVSWVSGKFGSAVRCDGSSESLTLSPISMGSEYSLEAWSLFPLYSPTTEGWRTLFQRQGGTYHHILVDVNGYIGCYNSGFYSSGFDVDNLSSGWHHIVAVASGGTTKFYIDGVLRGTSNVVVTADLSRMGNHDVNQQWGTFDEVHIYNRALTTSEISDLYLNYGYVTTNYPYNVLVRKYSSPEPTATVGAEEGTTGTTTTPVISPAYFCRWNTITYNTESPSGSSVTVDILDAAGNVLMSSVSSGADISSITASSIRLRATLTTTNPSNLPSLLDWTVSFYGVR